MVKKQSINKILKGKHSFFRAPGDYDRYRKKIIAGMDKEFNTGYAKNIWKGKHSFFRAPGDYDRYRKKIIAGMDKEFNTGYAKLSAQYKKDTARVLKALKKRRKK